MDLFLDAPVEKRAAPFTRLSENPHDWQSELLTEVYQQAPYLGEFNVRIVINEQDSERRYALGSIVVENKITQNPRDDQFGKEVQGVRQLFIPIIIREGKLSPLDVFLSNGRAQPLTQLRVRRSLFRPQIFEGISKRPGDQDILSLLYPPGRSGGIGFAGANFRTGDMQKQSSLHAPLLQSIQGTFDEADLRSFYKELSEPLTKSAFCTKSACLSAVKPLLQPQNTLSPRDQVEKIASRIIPKIIQVRQQHGDYIIKTANPDALLPMEAVVDRPTAVETVGADVVRTVEDGGQTVTISTDKAVKDSLIDIKVSSVETFGVYKVKTSEDKELVGWCFPFVLGLMGGEALPLKVFSNGSESAVQEQIAGVAVGMENDLIDERPSDTGCFYYTDKGTAVAFEPVTVTGEVSQPDKTVAYYCDTLLGESLIIKTVPGIKTATPISANEVAIPQECGFLPLRGPVSLAQTADEFIKTAQVRQYQNYAYVSFEPGGQTFSFRGEPIEKLAQVCPCKFVDRDQALFNLAILGVSPKSGIEKMAQACKSRDWVKFVAGPVTLARDLYQGACKTASALVGHPTVKQLLVGKRHMLKEASFLDDPLSVDKVLALGFLNTENIGTFISYLPEFETTLGKLSQLLIASRLGLSPLETDALERVIRHLDTVIQGLHDLSQYPKV